jgi:hypothetical protein
MAENKIYRYIRFQENIIDGYINLVQVYSLNWVYQLLLLGKASRHSTTTNQKYKCKIPC